MSRNALTGVTPGLRRNKRATQTRIYVAERASVGTWSRPDPPLSVSTLRSKRRSQAGRRPAELRLSVFDGHVRAGTEALRKAVPKTMTTGGANWPSDSSGISVG